MPAQRAVQFYKLFIIAVTGVTKKVTELRKRASGARTAAFSHRPGHPRQNPVTQLYWKGAAAF